MIAIRVPASGKWQPGHSSLFSDWLDENTIYRYNIINKNPG